MENSFILREEIHPKVESWFPNFFDFYYIYCYLERFCSSKIRPYCLNSTGLCFLPCEAVSFHLLSLITFLFIQTKTLLPICYFSTLRALLRFRSMLAKALAPEGEMGGGGMEGVGGWAGAWLQEMGTPRPEGSWLGFQCSRLASPTTDHTSLPTMSTTVLIRYNLNFPMLPTASIYFAAGIPPFSKLPHCHHHQAHSSTIFLLKLSYHPSRLLAQSFVITQIGGGGLLLFSGLTYS